MTAPTWRGPAAAIAAAALAASVLGAGIGLAESASAAPTAMQVTSSGTCSVPLSHGAAVLNRTTARMGSGRYLTSVVLTATGDPFTLVVDRGTATNRLARGAAGSVSATRSWTFSSRHGDARAHVAVVDTRTGAYGKTGC